MAKKQVVVLRVVRAGEGPSDRLDVYSKAGSFSLPSNAEGQVGAGDTLELTMRGNCVVEAKKGTTAWKVEKHFTHLRQVENVQARAWA